MCSHAHTDSHTYTQMHRYKSFQTYCSGAYIPTHTTGTNIRSHRLSTAHTSTQKSMIAHTYASQCKHSAAAADIEMVIDKQWIVFPRWCDRWNNIHYQHLQSYVENTCLLQQLEYSHFCVMFYVDNVTLTPTVLSNCSYQRAPVGSSDVSFSSKTKKFVSVHVSYKYSFSSYEKEYVCVLLNNGVKYMTAYKLTSYNSIIR